MERFAGVQQHRNCVEPGRATSPGCDYRSGGGGGGGDCGFCPRLGACPQLGLDLDATFSLINQRGRNARDFREKSYAGNIIFFAEVPQGGLRGGCTLIFIYIYLYT
ncbi:hypothetical protein BN874_840014 [Candidatus Contendobacter odensis Run_B_J11]|uniref:Uncharacterized protein n=1 Tax=Candidatus Contendobacter odensis Run_B_J11 TaxID=1400861 RepID=A0A7U7GFW4_9GAMM|nr:hypothetical protein BN874_840014 [Candidatus Contendobacter odensis Run_B_J11]